MSCEVAESGLRHNLLEAGFELVDLSFFLDQLVLELLHPRLQLEDGTLVARLVIPPHQG